MKSRGRVVRQENMQLGGMQMTLEETMPASAEMYDDAVAVPETIVKRDGRHVTFEPDRIESAIAKCFHSFGRTPNTSVSELTRRVVNIVAAKAVRGVPSVEEVQDIVEMVLQAAGEFEAAKRYILYRAEHAKERERRPVPEDVRAAFAASDLYFPTPIQKFQFFDKYSRFNYDLGRRETWIETVDRSVDFMHELAGDRLPRETYERIRKAILEMRAMPSMRLLAMAGPAARRNNIAIYNCSYQPVESIDSFVEALIISMAGCSKTPLKAGPMHCALACRRGGTAAMCTSICRCCDLLAHRSASRVAAPRAPSPCA